MDVAPAILPQRPAQALCSAPAIHQSPAAAADNDKALATGADIAGRAASPEVPLSAWAKPLERLLACSSQAQDAALLPDAAGLGAALLPHDICFMDMCKLKVSVAAADHADRPRATIIPDSDPSDACV
jgi:hypothetical protein